MLQEGDLKMAKSWELLEGEELTHSNFKNSKAIMLVSWPLPPFRKSSIGFLNWFFKIKLEKHLPN